MSQSEKQGRVYNNMGSQRDTILADHVSYRIQGSPFRFYCSEFRFFDQSLTFIFLNLNPKLPTFRTEIRFPVSSDNGENNQNFGLSDRNGEP